MSKKILIVDDEEGIRESLKLILEDHYPLILVENGSAALEVIKNTPDVGMVFLDIKMPQDNGLDVLEQIKAQRADLPVVMVTGYKFAETAAEAVKRGASGYIVKPFQSEEILGTVKKHLK
ncbi:MAG: response regulator [Candidatus Omnitrophota bacterium]